MILTASLFIMSEREQILADIERCELITSVTDGLGAEHSSMGMTNKYTDKQIERAERKLSMLRVRLNQIDEIDTQNPYIKKGIVC
jgi:hypothetical protein